MIQKNQKLSSEDVKLAKTLYEQGVTKARIARMFEVSRQRIQQILGLSTSKT